MSVRFTGRTVHPADRGPGRFQRRACGGAGQLTATVHPSVVELPESLAETFHGKPPIQQNYSGYWSVDSFDPDEWRKPIAVYWGRSGR